jgi:hypothetical protein
MNLRIRRRFFLPSLAATAATWSRAAGAQQMASVPLIGWVSSRSETESAAVRASFHKGLAEAGFVEGQNVAVVYRWTRRGPPTVVAAKDDFLGAYFCDLVGGRRAIANMELEGPLSTNTPWLSASRYLYRADSQGRKTCRSTSAASDKN